MEIVISCISGINNIVPNYDKSVEAFGHILNNLDRKSKIDVSNNN